MRIRGILSAAKQWTRKVLQRMGLLLIYKRICENGTAMHALICHLRYQKHLKRLRELPHERKIRVLFIVSEIAKWKEQRLYEVMEKTGKIEPIVGLSAWNRQRESNCSNAELENIHRKAEAFFARLGDRYVKTVTIENGKRIHHVLSEFSPDIVFYTEPWSPCPKQDPWTVSKYALTLYVPYFTPNYGVLEWDCHQKFHRLLFGYFWLNESWCKAYRDTLRYVAHCVKFIPVGHPGLDFFADCHDVANNENFVIYAPHYSFYNPNIPNYGQQYSTFDWNHKEILAYAKRHPDMKWMFKPHPLLREWVRKSGLMSDSELNEYFAEWGRVGVVCEDSDYQEAFLRSKAMITDSGSFLTEYGATGKPVIHLISSRNRIKPIFLIQSLYDTYYKVHNMDELQDIFKIVLEDGKDPKREERTRLAEEAGITNSHASAKIVEYILGFCNHL